MTLIYDWLCNVCCSQICTWSISHNDDDDDDNDDNDDDNDDDDGVDVDNNNCSNNELILSYVTQSRKTTRSRYSSVKSRGVSWAWGIPEKLGLELLSNYH